MRIVRDYFGLDRTTLTYENEITGVGGNADEFFIVAEVGKGNGTPNLCTAVHFTHEEMMRLLADYRRHYPMDGGSDRALLTGQAGRFLVRAWRRIAAFFDRRLLSRWCAHQMQTRLPKPSVPQEKQQMK